MSDGSGVRRLSAPMTIAAATASLVAVIAASAVATRPAFANDLPRQVPPRAAEPARAGSGSAPSSSARPAGPAIVTVPVQAATAPERTSPERVTLSITVDRAKVIRLPERTQTVVVGNPSIADLAIQKNGIVVVTGKSYGVTNLIALDGAGNMLAESTVSVGAATDAIMVVQRGLDRQSYSCTPSCQPSVLLGDANAYFNENRGQAEQRNQFATTR